MNVRTNSVKTKNPAVAGLNVAKIYIQFIDFLTRQ